MENNKDWFLCADGGGGVALIKDKQKRRDYIVEHFKGVTNIDKIDNKLLFMHICMESLRSSFEDLIEEYPVTRSPNSALCQIVNYDDIKL